MTQEALARTFQDEPVPPGGAARRPSVPLFPSNSLPFSGRGAHEYSPATAAPTRLLSRPLVLSGGTGLGESQVRGRNRRKAGTSTIIVTSTGGFNPATTLSAGGLPGGVTASFFANVTISGSSGSTNHSTPVALRVNASSGTKSFTMSLSPSSFTMDDSGSVSTTFTITSLNGFHSAMELNVNEFPGGGSATASANPVTPPANGSVHVTIVWSISRRASSGTTTIDRIGTCGSIANDIPLTITVAP